MMATQPAKPAIYLLDSMGFIFRAYHAMQRQRPMSTRSGVPTAAVYVFVNMLSKLRRDFSPQYLAAVFDVSGAVFRDERAKDLKIRKFNATTQAFDEVAYAGYKANRSEMPPDLVQQVPYIRRALDALRIPILQQEGFEADDVIGTLSRQASQLGHPVYIVSNDKDMMQLVGDNVFVLNPAKDNLVLDRAGVVAALGVPPEQVIDVMALRGDSIDNIPGAEAAIAASGSGGGLSRLMGGGLMALGAKLMGLGLGMAQIQNIARELFRFGRDKIGADQMGEIIAGTPGLKQLA